MGSEKNRVNIALLFNIPTFTHYNYTTKKGKVQYGIKMLPVLLKGIKIGSPQTAEILWKIR